MNDGFPTKAPYSRASLLAQLTGASVLAAGSLLYGQGTSSLASLGLGGAGQVLIAGASAPAWSGTGLTFASGILNVAGTIASTSTTTGALTVAGGVGIGGALYVGGNVNCTRVVASDYIYASKNTNAGFQCFIENLSNGSSAYTQLTLSNDASPYSGIFAVMSSTNVAYGAGNAGCTIVGTNFAKPLILVTNGAARLTLNGTTGAVTCSASVACTTLTVSGKITSVSSVPASFTDLAAIRTWLAANFT